MLGGGGGILTAAVLALGAAHATITDGPTGSTESTTATFSFRASGASVLGSFECRLDGARWEACRSPDAESGLGGGQHSFEVRLTGPLADPTPDRRDWTVEQRTVISPAPVAPARPSAPEAPARPPRRHDARSCAYAANEPGEVRSERLRAAVVCLIDVERRQRGLRPLRSVAALERAAAAQARDMVARRYFAHVTPTGRGVVARVSGTGYLRGTRAWTLGEVLAWLVRPRPTPVATVDAWMASPPHRAVLLGPAFRDIGIAVAPGNPRTGAAGATWVGELGRRS